MNKFFKLTANEKNARNCLHHRGEIVLVDHVLECHGNRILTQTTINANHLFLTDFEGEKVFPLYQSIELIAQSLACYQKIYNSNLNQYKKPKIGFLLSARNFEIFTPFAKNGQTLLTEVEITTQDENGFGVCEGRVFFDCLRKENLACQSSVSVLSPEGNFKDFIKED